MATWTGAAGGTDWYYSRHTHFGYPDDVVLTNWSTAPNFPASSDSINISGATVTNGDGTYASILIDATSSLSIGNNAQTALLGTSSFTNAGAFKAFQNSELYLTGGFSNSGAIIIEPAAIQLPGIVLGSGVGALTGGGTITLAPGTGITADSNQQVTFTNADNAIQGAGTIGNGYGTLTLVNGGVINANDNSAQLVLSPGGGITNRSLIEATGSAGLHIGAGGGSNPGGTTVDNTQGVIRADAGSHIDLQYTTLKGGISSVGTGYIQTLDPNSILDGTASPFSISGTLNVTAGNGLTVKGSVVNAGTINFQPIATSAQGGAGLSITASGLTLSGGGVINMGSASNGYIGNSFGQSGTFTNNGNTIVGAGAISGYGGSITLINNGTIEATIPGVELTLSTLQTITNNGILEANAGTLTVDDAVSGSGYGVIANGGVMQFNAASNQNVAFQGAGTLRLSQAFNVGIFGFGAGDTLDLTNVAFAAGEHLAFQSSGGGLQTFALQDAGGATLQTLYFAGGDYSQNLFAVANDGSGHAAITLNHAPVSLTDTHDFNASGASDIVLQNGGTVIDWLMQNGVYQSGNVITTGAAGYSVVGAGDFNGDGTSDILVQNGGTVIDWLMQNGVYQSGNVITTGAAGYSVVGAGDFNGDGTTDILLQSGGTVVDWLMQNGVYQSGNVITTGATGYSVVGTGDFNNDGSSDILLQSGGTVVEWLMQNGVYQSGSVITTGATGFSVVATGDFNGDSTSDILLQSGGTVIDWLMQNGAYQSGNVITTGAAGYNVVGTGDYNSDGVSDVLLQSGGTVIDWLMHNGAYQSGNVITTGADGYTAK